MGHRANYVLIENGEHRIYFSRWGALTIPSVLISGPDATLEYVRALTPDSTLLNDTWSEGGLLLDLDAHRVRFFGGLYIDSAPYLRRLLLPVLAELWPDWDVQWALYGIVDLAIAIGWDSAQVADRGFDDPRLLDGDEPLIQPSQLQTLPSHASANFLLTVRWNDGAVADFATETFRLDALSLGPSLVDLLRSKESAPLPREDEAPQCGFLDTRTRELWLSDLSDPRYGDALSRRWPRWSVRVHTEGLVRQIALSGRDATAYKVPREQAVQRLLTDLLKDDGIDPQRLYEAMSQNGEAITVGKAFFSKDSPPSSADERRELLLRLCERVEDY